jgi:hypothetical protein
MNFTEVAYTVIKNITTEKDGVTWCPARILWILGTFAYFVLAGYHVWNTKQFDYLSFGSGFAAIQASGAAAVRIKIQTEQ